MMIAERARCVDRVFRVVVINDDGLFRFGVDDGRFLRGNSIILIGSDNDGVGPLFDDDDLVAFCVAGISPVIAVRFQLRVAASEGESR